MIFAPQNGLAILLGVQSRMEVVIGGWKIPVRAEWMAGFAEHWADMVHQPQRRGTEALPLPKRLWWCEPGHSELHPHRQLLTASSSFTGWLWRLQPGVRAEGGAVGVKKGFILSPVLIHDLLVVFWVSSPSSEASERAAVTDRPHLCVSWLRSFGLGLV